jgi:NAD(P)H-hydrate epimerase
MYIVTAKQMSAIDAAASAVYLVPSIVLMENAGRSVAEEILATYPAAKRWLVLAGKGNNGADGVVAARYLTEAGCHVAIYYMSDPEGLQDKAALQRDMAVRLGIPLYVFAEGQVDWARYDGVIDALLGTGTHFAPLRGLWAQAVRQVNAAGLTVVAVDLPSGLNPDNGQAGADTIRADLTVTFAYSKCGLEQYPGVDYAGQVVVRDIGIPQRIVAQQGVSTYKVDDAVWRQLGIEMTEVLREQPLAGQRMPKSQMLGLTTRGQVMQVRQGQDQTVPGQNVPAVHRPRGANVYKNTYGHALVIAGSAQMSGAGVLTAHAALRAGAGLVTWALPAGALATLGTRPPEIMVHPAGEEWAQTAPHSLLQLAHSKDVVMIGPGLGRWQGDEEWLRTLWEQLDVPLVLDADALNILSSAKGLTQWPRRQAATVLTPHPGEMKRLVRADMEAAPQAGEGGSIAVSEDMSPAEDSGSFALREIGRTAEDSGSIASYATAQPADGTVVDAPNPLARVTTDRIAVAREFAHRHGVTLVLKGARTLTADPSGAVYINPSGNAGMATAGSGDVLTGIVGAYLAQGLSATAAAVLAVYRHGDAGDRVAAVRYSTASLLASDIISAL